MDKKGLNLEIPGWGELRLQQALFDLNGTLALDGILSNPVKERLHRLQDILAIYLVTADTHGTAADLVHEFGSIEIARIRPGNEARQKSAVLSELGAWCTVAFGNGANDVLMLSKACLGVCLMQGEGTATPALLASDVLVRSAEEALDLLLCPARLVATLRS